jgi:hypothetical protein
MAAKPSLTPIPSPSVPAGPKDVPIDYGPVVTAKLAPPKQKSFLTKVKENLLQINPATASFNAASKSLQTVSGKYSKSTNPIVGIPAREAQELGKIVEHVPQGGITFAGGLGIDAAESVVQAMTLGKYRAGLGTSIGMAKSMGSTLSLLTGSREMEYWNALKHHQAITHLILEDAGNLFFLGEGIGAIAHGAGPVIGEASTQQLFSGISKESAVPIFKGYGPEFIPTKVGGGLAGAFGEKAAAAEAAGSETAATRWGQLENASLNVGKSANYLASVGEKVMQLPFKPYVEAAQYINSSYRSGVLFGKEWGAWGQSAANKYSDQLVKYKEANPDAPMNDPVIRELTKKIGFHNNNAISSLVKKEINKAARMELFATDSTKRIVSGIKTDPLYKKDINPTTGKEWGELSPAEEQAVIASVNGRAQLIKWLSETIGMEPKELALVGRVNERPEMWLDPNGASLGVDFLNHTSQNPTMSDAQYERLSDAVDRLVKSSVDATHKAVSGWGRKNPLSVEYLTPTPIVKYLERNLKSWGNKPVLELFNKLAEEGVWDLPVDDIHRVNMLMAIVQMLPDEIALDASMYPATMRENIAFYRRVRIELGREMIGNVEGNPMPPLDQPPVGPEGNPLTRKSGKLTAASDLISSVRSKIEKTARNIDKINERIAIIEAKHQASVDELRKYDIIDAHLNGVDHKVIAKKFKMTVAEVDKFLSRKRIVVAFEALKISEANVRSLEEAIGKKRSAMDEDASLVEIEKMQKQLTELRRIADEAQRAYDSAQNVNEAARQMEQDNNNQAAEEIFNLDDNLFDAQTEFIKAGGDPSYFDIPDDIIDPMNQPITVGSGRTYYEGLIDFIDNVLTPTAKEVSPAMEADVARIKVIISESWNKAETNYYNSPTEAIAAINQARVIQLGNLMRDLALNANTPGHMIENTIRDKTNLDILSGVTSPFEIPKRGNGKLLAEGQKPLPPVEENQRTVEYVAEQLPRIDPSTDYKQQLLDMAADVEYPGTYKTTTWRSPKKEVDVSKIVDINYEQYGYPVSLRIEYKANGSVSTARLQYETWTYNNDRAGANTGRTAIELDLKSGASVMEQVGGSEFKYPDSPQSLDAVLRVIDETIAIWDVYKQDPFSNNIKNVFEYINQINGIELNTQLRLNEGNIRFEWPEMDKVPKTVAGKAKAMKVIDEFDAEIVKFKKFIDETFGSSRATREAGLLPVAKATPQDALLTNTTSGMNTRADYVIIPCSAAKLNFAAPAAELYTGSMFKDSLETARKMFSDDKIFILSAKHGLVSLDTVLAPYDVKLGNASAVEWNTISVQLRELGITGDVLSLLPKDYHALLSRSLEGAGRGAPIRSHGIQLENFYEGSKGIGEQKGRLSQLRKDAEASVGDPAPRIEDAIGAIELSPELEIKAKEAAADPEVMKQLQNDHEDILAIERDIEAVSNPTAEDIKAYREQQLKFHNDEIVTQTGFARATLGGGFDKRTGKLTWHLSPVKGMPEWDWWFNGLDGIQRQVIARDFFRTTEFKSGAFSGPRYVRKGTGIDVYADEANMTVDEFGAALLDVVDKIQKARRDIRNVKATEDAILGDEFTKINLDELNNYKSRYELTADEYGAIVDRANHLSGVEANPRTVELLRPIADRPADVVEDLAIIDPVIRQAVYEDDILKAMAKDASLKMKKAERLSDRIAAFDQWLHDSEKYKAEALDLIEKKRRIEAKRIVQDNRETKLRELKKLRGTEKAKLTRMIKSEAKLIESVPNQRLTLLPGSGPLKAALDESLMYPSQTRDIGYVDAEGMPTSVQMRGPMYLPTGGRSLLAGGLKKEYSAEGTSGNIKLSNEYYRSGDRETIFSMRLLATRFGESAGQMSANESFRYIVSLFGKKPMELLDESVYIRLREEAKAEALGNSKATIEVFYSELAKAAAENGLPIPEGMGAYAPGVLDPAKALKLMEDEIYGAKILGEMQNLGLKPVDPFSKIEKSIPYNKITEQTFFLPDGMKEQIAREHKIISPNKYGNKLLAASHYITSKFKTTTLAFSVTWQLGDLISNTIVSQMSGVDAATLIQRMNQVGQAEYGSLRALWDPLTPMENGKTPYQQKLSEFLQSAPVQDVSLSQQERYTELGIKAPEPRKSMLRRVGEEVGIPENLLDRNPIRVSFKVNETINRIQRHAYFLELMDRAIKEKFGNSKTLENIIDDGSWRNDQSIHDLMFEVADTANKWLGDFADLTMNERKYITQIVPFYGWIKHIHKVFWALASEHPQALAWYFYIGSLGFDPNEDPMGLKYGGTNLFGGVLSTNFLNPLSDVLNGPLAYLYGGDKRNALRGQGPVPRLVGALGFGVDTTSLTSIQRAPGAGGYSASGSALNGGLLNLAGGGTIGESLGFAIQQFPLANRLVQASPVSGNIPGTRIALGPVNTYKTGEARLSPQTNQRIPKWGGTAAAIGRLFSLPGIPYQTDKQIASVEKAARARLKTIETMKKRRANSKAP